ncbi:hypothetical protein BC833DRAFT_565938 [Globomyces pollinis-pini]|nr:hypothetical protein BC833DRAFT_565938 [Globomyces pollinis-pini]
MSILYLLLNLALALTTSQTAEMGMPCSIQNGDRTACDNSYFLQCSDTSSRWVIQNNCNGPCMSDPSFSSSCFMLAPKSTTTTTTTTPSSSSISTGTVLPNTPNLENSNGGLSVFAWIALGFGLLLFLLLTFLAYFILSKRISNGGFGIIAKPGSKKPSDVLDKRYIVIMDYTPVASDEVAMQVGDIVVLDLLFNDGWAKGKNHSNNQAGILPVACIEEIP